MAARTYKSEPGRDRGRDGFYARRWRTSQALNIEPCGKRLRGAFGWTVREIDRAHAPNPEEDLRRDANPASEGPGDHRADAQGGTASSSWRSSRRPGTWHASEPSSTPTSSRKISARMELTQG